MSPSTAPSQTSPEFFFVSDDDDSTSENGTPESPATPGTCQESGTIPCRADSSQRETEVERLSREMKSILEPTPIGPNCFYFMGSSGPAFPLLQDFPGFKSFPKSVDTLAEPTLNTPMSSHLYADLKRRVSITNVDSIKDEFSMDSMIASETTKKDKFRVYQENQWMVRFRELKEYHAEHGHCLVPHFFAPNQALAQWVKRQRYQYKLKHMMGRHSTLSDARQTELEKLGFIWNFHNAAWYERLESLKEFKSQYGHTSVPGNCRTHKSLAIWVKCQRRQMKCLKRGLQSSLTEDRIEALEQLGFIWNPRNLS